MAVSKETCFAIGETMFVDGEPRPVGESWQAKAQQQGWDEAYTASHGRKIAAPHPAVHHMNQLLEMARTERNFTRCQRLMNKANGLHSKLVRHGVLARA